MSDWPWFMLSHWANGLEETLSNPARGKRRQTDNFWQIYEHKSRRYYCHIQTKFPKWPILRYDGSSLWHLYPLRKKFSLDSYKIFTIILDYDRDQMTKILAQAEQYFRFHTIGCPYFSPFYFTLQLATVFWSILAKFLKSSKNSYFWPN